MRDGLLRLASTASLALAPVLVVQGRAVRRRTPRLPEAEPPFEGAVTGAAPGLRLLVLGESTAAGVGVSRHEEGLAGQTARALAATTGCGVRWTARGRNGATAFETHRDLLPAVTMPRADVVVLALGVNDTVRLHAPRRWTRDSDDTRRGPPRPPPAARHRAGRRPSAASLSCTAVSTPRRARPACPRARTRGTTPRGPLAGPAIRRAPRARHP